MTHDRSEDNPAAAGRAAGPAATKLPIRHITTNELACRLDPHHGQAARHVTQVARLALRPAEPCRSPIRLSS